MANTPDAVIWADNLLTHILTTQTHLLQPQAGYTQTTGKHIGEMIAALREELIAMYQKTPR